MRGHVRLKKSGSWEIFVEMGREPKTGKRKQYSETIKGTKKQAEHRLAELIDQIEGKVFIRPERVTFGQWLKKWYDSYVVVNTRNRTLPHTGTRYASILTPTLDRYLSAS